MNSAIETLNIYNEFKQWYLLLGKNGHVYGKYHDIKTIHYQENEGYKNYHKMPKDSYKYFEKALDIMHREIYEKMLEIMRDDIRNKRDKEIKNLNITIEKLQKIDI